MDVKHPENIDPRPKRQKDRDNPYTIFSTGTGLEEPHYYLSFRDGQGKNHRMEISRELFVRFIQFGPDDLSFLNEVDNHHEHSELTGISLHTRDFGQQEDLEGTIFVEWITSGYTLPEVHRRPATLYFFEEYSCEEIAKMEGCTKRAVKFRADLALENPKEKSKKFLISDYTLSGPFSQKRTGMTIEEAAGFTGIGRNTLVSWEKIPVLWSGRKAKGYV